jgi:hypothetical protein
MHFVNLKPSSLPNVRMRALYAKHQGITKLAPV